MMSKMRHVETVAALIWVSIMLGAAQEPDSTLSRLRRMHLPESPGSVPVFYVPEAEERALQYREQLQNARSWFEEQLHIQVPMALAVVDRETYSVLHGEWPHPYSDLESDPPVVVFPTNLEEVLGAEPKVQVPGEYIAYHEAGHIFANRLKIWSGNAFVNELIANMFEAAYVQVKRPDLAWLFEAPPSRFAADPRYTSLADLDYIYTGVGFDNMAWFQYQLQKVAKHLVSDRPFAVVVNGLKSEFPAQRQRQETIEAIVQHLDTIRGGTKTIMGKLAGPATLPRVQPAACPKSEASGPLTFIAVRNNTAQSLSLELPSGSKSTVAPGSWRSYPLTMGASLRLRDGSCLVAATEPALAAFDGR